MAVPFCYVQLDNYICQILTYPWQNIFIYVPVTSGKKSRESEDVIMPVFGKRRRPLHIAQLLDDSIVALTNDSRLTAHAQCYM